MAAPTFEIPKTMKALVFQDKGKIELVTKPVPEPALGEVLVKLTATTICGTDVHIMKGEYPVKKGLTLGHEPVGVVVKLGQGITTLKVGDRVCVPAITPCGICPWCQEGLSSQCGGVLMGGWKFGNTIDGCQAEYVVVPNAEYNCAPIPAGMTDEEVVMCCDIMSTGFSAIEHANVHIGDSVAVWAQGPIGLCATGAAKLSGATTIITVDGNPERLRISREFGADHPVNFKEVKPQEEIERLTHGRRVDVAVEALGTQPTFESCFRALKCGGKLSSLGVYSNDLRIPCDAMAAGLGDHHILFSLCPGGKERMRRLMECIRMGRFPAKKLITHHFKLDQIVEAYDLFSNQRDGVLKVIITF